MACIDREFCKDCNKVTEHMSYVGDADHPPISEHCVECAAREIRDAQEADRINQEKKDKSWSEMTLEEKVENLNSRLRDAEVSNMTF